MSDQLSATMAIVLAETIDHGGKLERHAGGYWTYPGCPRSWTRHDWSAPTTTIEALVRRGKLEYTEWRDGRKGKFPIAASVVSEAA